MATASITGSLVSQAQNSILQSREESSLRQMQSAQGVNDNGRIEKGAKEFEAMLLNSWLQQAEQSMASVPGSDSEDEEDVGRQQMMSLGVQALSSSLAASGGIGIANMIANALHSKADNSNSLSADVATGNIEQTEKQR